jgi:quercetin dioxygenase-like cupin family protein
MADLNHAPRRFVTGHTPSGSATVIYESRVPDKRIAGTNPNDGGARFSVLWQSKQPSENAVPAEDAALLPVSIARSDGSVCRVVDMAPGHSSQLHRTISLDYGIVVAGDGMELELENTDGGPNEVRKLRIGDVVVQRGTNHAWHNRGDGWCRMVFILLGAEKIVLPNGASIDGVASDIKDGKLG